MGTAEAVEERCRDTEWAIRLAAVDALVEVCPCGRLPNLLTVLGSRVEDSDRRVRQAALAAIARVVRAGDAGDSGSVGELLSHAVCARLKDEADEVVLAVFETLSLLVDQQLVTDDVLQAVVRTMEHKDYHIRLAAVRALGQLGVPGESFAMDLRRPVLARLADPDWRVRGAALDTLELLVPAGSAPEALLLDVVHLTRSPEWATRVAALDALGRVLGPVVHTAAEEALMSAVQDEHAHVREQALAVLCRVYPHGAAPLEARQAVLTRLDDTDRVVRQVSSQAVYRMMTPGQPSLSRPVTRA